MAPFSVSPHPGCTSVALLSQAEERQHTPGGRWLVCEPFRGSTEKQEAGSLLSAPSRGHTAYCFYDNRWLFFFFFNVISEKLAVWTAACGINGQGSDQPGGLPTPGATPPDVFPGPALCPRVCLAFAMRVTSMQPESLLSRTERDRAACVHLVGTAVFPKAFCFLVL